MPLQDFIFVQSTRFIAYNSLGRHYDERSDQTPRRSIPLIMIHVRIWWCSLCKKLICLDFTVVCLYLEQEVVVLIVQISVITSSTLFL